MNNIPVISFTLPDLNKVRDNYGAYDEIPYAVFINGRHIATVLLAPGDQKEFIFGYLFTEQYISGVGEIESVRLEKNRISVITTNLFTNPGPKKTILSGCGGAVSYIDTAKLPVIQGNFRITVKSLFDLCYALKRSEGQDRISIATASLFQGTDLLIQRYDVSGDQVIDRIIGGALISNIDINSSCCLYSGTISSETVRKGLIAQIPLIMTSGRVTKLAIDIAEKNGMSLIVLSDDKISICSHPERII
jgi:FdhD protein